VFKPSTVRTTQRQRRRIHDAKNNRARYFASANRKLVRESAIALMVFALMRYAAITS
jgi:hypothetical protein